ncbi:MAG: hypothetical protein LJE83_04235 [Gammaproteobacteria bacterium]|nr:hypothetical protein [Gammaproteobacteria bacterium]
MSEDKKIDIETEAEFLANVIALKMEFEERLEGLADCLAIHNNPAASDVFRGLASHITSNIQKLEAVAANHQLPVIPPWEYQWHCSDDPEALCIDQAHYMMSSRQALELALFNEKRSVEFLNKVVDQVNNNAVKQLAAGMIAMEQEFTESMQQALDDMEDDMQPCEDLDPPNMPE